MKPAGLKKNKFRIFSAWLLLVCFAAGQYMVYVHQHKIGVFSSVAKNQTRPLTSVQEKCYMCDVMHNTMAILTQNNYFNPVAVAQHIYKVGDYNFVSIALILSAGRGPPASDLSC